MCVISMVYDRYKDLFPPVEPTITAPAIPIGVVAPANTPATNFFLDHVIVSKKEIEALKQLIKDFKEAVEAAKTVDRLTGQPDCLDPDKAKLDERVTALEKALSGKDKPKSKPAKKTKTRKVKK